jgi:hypothetical protein
MVIPLNDAMLIHENIPGSQFDNETQSFTVPCDTNASIALTYGGKAFTIDPRDLARKFRDSDTVCPSGITAGSVGGNRWLVSVTFLFLPLITHIFSLSRSAIPS